VESDDEMIDGLFLPTTAGMTAGGGDGGADGDGYGTGTGTGTGGYMVTNGAVTRGGYSGGSGRGASGQSGSFQSKSASRSGRGGAVELQAAGGRGGGSAGGAAAATLGVEMAAKKGHESVPTDSKVDSADGSTAGGAVLAIPSGGKTVGGPQHSADLSMHSQLLPDHVDLDNLDDDLDELFGAWDADSDGKLTAKELADATGVSEERAKEIISNYDTNEDGVLDEEEFEALKEAILKEEELKKGVE